jgi:simple sugar transport system ATP-binding protein
MRGISKAFGAVQALRRVDLEVWPGEVVGLVGDNAAGKSTLMKILYGIYTPDEGEILVESKAVVFHTAHDARAHGIEMVYQDLALVDNLDIAANVFVGRELTRRFLGGLVEVLDKRRMERAAAQVVQTLDPDLGPVRRKVKILSGGQRQTVAIARSLCFEPKVMIMDEPTASLSLEKIHRLLELIQRLKARGLGIILISHRVQDIFTVGDRVVVLKRGEVVGERRIRDTSLEEVVQLMVAGSPQVPTGGMEDDRALG